MEDDPASLSKLNDIVIPPEVSMWPLAPGWWFLFLLVSALATWIAYRSYRAWQANAYRREALQELETASSPATVVAILRRCALVVAPRSEIAKLTGNAWPNWLARYSSAPPPAEIVPLLVSGPYLRDLPSDSVGELKRYATTWIRTHQRVN